MTDQFGDWTIKIKRDEDGRIDTVDSPLTGMPGQSAYTSIEMIDSDEVSVSLFRDGEHLLLHITAGMDADERPILMITEGDRWED